MAKFDKVTISAGSRESDEIPHASHEIQVHKPQGEGGQRALRAPRYQVQPSGQGSKIVLDVAHDQDVTFRVTGPASGRKTPKGEGNDDDEGQGQPEDQPS